MTVGLVLCSTGVAVTVMGFAVGVLGYLPRWRASGWCAVGYVLHLTGLGLEDAGLVYRVIDMILGAGFAVHWWHGGGGDGTRRRLRRAAEMFRPVRRTAPQAV